MFTIDQSLRLTMFVFLAKSSIQRAFTNVSVKGEVELFFSGRSDGNTVDQTESL